MRVRRPGKYPARRHGLALHEAFARVSMAPGVFMAIKTILCSMFATLALLAPSPARADRCDDLAGQLKNQIDGLSVGKTAANAIYLSHPAAKQLMLGCPNRKFTFELIAGSDSRKPKPAF